MTQRDLRIRPLSEGIGLGALKTPTPKIHQTDIDTSVMRQAHAAYLPNSVEAEIRKRVATNFYVKIVRFFSSAGVDFFVGIFSAFIVSWISVLAWSAGETGVFDVVGALNIVTNFLSSQAVVVLIVGAIMVAGFCRLLRVLLDRFS